MKKLWTILMTSMLAVSLTFTACGSAENQAEPEASEETAEAAGAQESTAERADSEAEESEATEEAGEAELPEEEQAVSPYYLQDAGYLVFTDEAGIEETVIAEEDSFTITAKDLTYDPAMVYLSVVLENKGDAILMFDSGMAYRAVNTVNGYYCEDMLLYAEIGPGESLEQQFYIDKDVLLQCGITTIADMQIDFMVYGDGNAPTFVSGEIQTTASGYDYAAESFGSAVRNPEFMTDQGQNLTYYTDEIDYDCGGLRICSAAAVTQDDDEFLYLELENPTEEDLVFSAEAAGLNGLYVPYAMPDILVPAGKKTVRKTNLTYLTDPAIAAQLGLGEISSVIINSKVIAVENIDRDLTGMFMHRNPQTWEEDLAQLQRGTAEVTIPVTDGEEKNAAYESLAEMINEDGFSLDAVGVTDSADQDEIFFLFAAVNHSGSDLRFEVGDNTNHVTLNGSDAVLYNRNNYLVPDGGTGIIRISLDEDRFEEAGVTGAADITDLAGETSVYSGYTNNEKLFENTFSITY